MLVYVHVHVHVQREVSLGVPSCVYVTRRGGREGEREGGEGGGEGGLGVITKVVRYSW